jgi:hypothetical protein
LFIEITAVKDMNHKTTAIRVKIENNNGTRMILLVFAKKSDEASITSIALTKEDQQQ